MPDLLDIGTLDAYKEGLRIDKDNLDEELIRQAAVYYEICEKAALANSIRDTKYRKTKEVYAQVSLDTREWLLAEGAKVTESSVDARVRSSDDYIAVMQDHLEANHLAEQMDALKDAYKQRSYMLKELVQLYVSGYYMDSHGDGGYAPSRKSAQLEEKLKQGYRERKRLRSANGGGGSND